MVDGYLSKLVNVVFWEGKRFGSTVFPPVHRRAFSIEGINLYLHADDSSLVDVVQLPGERVAVTESLNRNMNRVCT